MIGFFGRRRLDKRVVGGVPIEVWECRGVRTLHLGSQAVQSAMRVARPASLELAYTRAMMAWPLFCPGAREVLMIGLGGGSLAKYMLAREAGLRVTAVEIEPVVAELARRHFALPDDSEHFRVRMADAADYVPAHPAQADVILLDGYDAGDQVEQLATEAFYRACRRALRSGGVLVVNLWGGSPDFDHYFSRLCRVFDGRLAWLPVESKSNVVVFAFGAEVTCAERESARALGRRWGLDLSAYARSLQWFEPLDDGSGEGGKKAGKTTS